MSIAEDVLYHQINPSEVKIKLKTLPPTDNQIFPMAPIISSITRKKVAFSSHVSVSYSLGQSRFVLMSLTFEDYRLFRRLSLNLGLLMLSHDLVPSYTFLAGISSDAVLLPLHAIGIT